MRIYSHFNLSNLTRILYPFFQSTPLVLQRTLKPYQHACLEPSSHRSTKTARCTTLRCFTYKSSSSVDQLSITVEPRSRPPLRQSYWLGPEVFRVGSKSFVWWTDVAWQYLDGGSQGDRIIFTVESWDQDTLSVNELLVYRMRGEGAAQIEVSPQVKVQ